MIPPRPNLFDYATSELSQDAFLCWLLSWADTENADLDVALHRTGTSLLKHLYRAAGLQFPVKVKVDVRRQHLHIDILCVVNGSTAVLIEDKTGTKEHGNQLQNYINAVASKLKITRDNIIPIYVQTRDQSDYSQVTKYGYKLLLRQELLTLLDQEEALAARQVSSILSDFYSHLRRIEDAVQSYAHKLLDEWHDSAWKGFYMRVQQEFPDARWDYIANPSGGFVGLWWHWKDAQDCCLYLQLKQKELCFKIQVKDETKRKQLRMLWSRKLLQQAANGGLKVTEPDRFGNGQFMTVCALPEYRAKDRDGFLDFDETCSLLRKAERLLDACVSNPEIQ